MLKQCILAIRPELLEKECPLFKRQAFRKINARGKAESSQGHAASWNSGLQIRCQQRCTLQFETAASGKKWEVPMRKQNVVMIENLG